MLWTNQKKKLQIVCNSKYPCYFTIITELLHNSVKPNGLGNWFKASFKIQPWLKINPRRPCHISVWFFQWLHHLSVCRYVHIFNIKYQVINHKGTWLGKFLIIILVWTKKSWLERELNQWPPVYSTVSYTAAYCWMASDWHPRTKILTNRETTNIGLNSSVGRAPVR